MINLNIFQSINFSYKKLTIILVILFVLIRLYLLQWPKIENSIWKEIDYIEISKNYNEEGVKFWEPTISWPAEEPRVTAMEFPLVPYTASILYKLFGFNAFTLRIITLISFILLSLYFYKIVVLLTSNKSLAFLTLLISLIMPLNYIHGRLLFSEPVIITLVIISIYHMLKWKMNDQNRFFIWAFIFLSLSLLLKPTAMYAALPLIYLYYLKTGNLRVKSYFPFGLALLLALIPPIIWYAYAYHLTKVSIDVFSVFRGHNKFQTFNMLSDPYWWKVMIDRFQQLFGGTIFLLIFVFGFLSGLTERKFRLFYVIFLANLAFLFIVAEGHLDAPYRQFAFIASGAFFTALGIVAIYSLFINIYRKIAPEFRFIPTLKNDLVSNLIYIGVIFIILANFYYNVLSSPEYKGNITFKKIAEKLDSIKSEDSKLVTAGNYTVHKGGNDLSPVLYYYSNIQGWSLERNDWDLAKIKKLKLKGADIFVGLNIYTHEAADFIDKVSKHYSVIHRSEDYIICDLTEQKNNAKLPCNF